LKLSQLFLATALVLAWLSSCSTAPENTAPADEEFGPHPGLRSPALVQGQAPAVFSVRFETTKGDFTMECRREWAPRGVDRFFNLVQVGYFEEVAFYRVLEGYIVQFGTHGNPEVTQIWSAASIADDPVKIPNEQGTLTFAQEAPNSRTTQLFINLADNSSELDPYGLAPICRVIEGMDTVDSIYSGYGEMHPKGEGPRPNLLQKLGNKYLRRQFPEMDYIRQAVIVSGESPGGTEF